MAAMTIFHCRQTDSFLSRTNPLAKLIALISYSVLISMTDCWLSLFLSTIPFIIIIAIRIPLKEYIKESIFFILIAAAMFVSSCISSRECIPAAAKAAGFLAAVAASILLTDSTMPDDLSRSLGSALSHILGRYAYVLSSIVEITLSMIPLIIDSAEGMLEARKARGDSFAAHPFRSVSELTAGILSDLLDKAEVYADALLSRGYDASARRGAPSYSRCDRIILTACAAILAVLLIRKIM